MMNFSDYSFTLYLENKSKAEAREEGKNKIDKIKLILKREFKEKIEFKELLGKYYFIYHLENDKTFPIILDYYYICRTNIEIIINQIKYDIRRVNNGR